MYTKLFGSIVHSTIWREPDHIRLVWITMLALCDKNGCVWAAVPGLADAARVSIDQCEEAIERLSAPDKYSRTQVAEGRRIEAIDGGWFLINHAKFQAIKNMDERRDAVRLAVQRHRAKEKGEPVINVISGNHGKPLRSDQTRPTKKRASRPATAPTTANSAQQIVAAILSLAQQVDAPGQGVKRYIPRNAVAEMGEDVLRAYDQLGGAERFLNQPADKLQWLVKDFGEALGAQ